jgi:opacity protein-like surface antigen
MPIHSIQAAALAVLLGAAPAAAQVAEQHFRGGRTADLAALCAASPREALGSEAIAWCHGFVVAAAQYHASASAEGGAHRPVFCLPEPAPTLDDARTGFVAWVRANPQHGTERAMDGLMRFAAATFPCPRPEAARRGR